MHSHMISKSMQIVTMILMEITGILAPIQLEIPVVGMETLVVQTLMEMDGQIRMMISLMITHKITILMEMDMEKTQWGIIQMLVQVNLAVVH